MSSIVVAGDTSGSITISAPAVAGTNTLTLPANTGTVITTASSGQSIPKAALPTGSVLQVVSSTYSTAETTTSTTYQASGLSVTITPTSSSSKILIVGSVPFDTYGGTVNQAGLTLYRGSSTNLASVGFCIVYSAGSSNIQNTGSINYLDSPATTSATTYKIYFRVTPGASGGTPTARVFVDSYTGSLTAMEIAA